MLAYVRIKQQASMTAFLAQMTQITSALQRPAAAEAAAPAAAAATSSPPAAAAAAAASTAQAAESSLHRAHGRAPAHTQTHLKVRKAGLCDFRVQVSGVLRQVVRQINWLHPSGPEESSSPLSHPFVVWPLPPDATQDFLSRLPAGAGDHCGGGCAVPCAVQGSAVPEAAAGQGGCRAAPGTEILR